MPSPACTVKDGSGSPQTTPPYATVTPGNTVTIALASAAGVDTWAITCPYADESTDPTAITLTVNSVAKTATFTAPAAGKSLIFRSVINGGQLNGVTESSYTTTFKVSTLTAGGVAVGAANETLEHDSTYGATALLNEGVRASAGYAVHAPVRVATTAALATNTRSGNVLTASANGALASQDGVSLAVGDRILVWAEATGANNGIYDVTSLGSGGTPWVLTRSTDADASRKLVPGCEVRVSEGTVYADQKFVLTTNATITLNTTSLTFALATAPSLDGTSGNANITCKRTTWLTTAGQRVISENVDAVNTTDATQTTLYSFTLSATSTYVVRAAVVALRTGGSSGSAGDAWTEDVKALVQRVASGNAAIVSSVANTGTIKTGTVANAATIDVTGNDVRVRVTGIANNNIRWRAVVTVQEIG